MGFSSSNVSRFAAAKHARVGKLNSDSFVAHPLLKTAFCALALAAICMPASVNAAVIQYELSGTTAAPLRSPIGGSKNFIVDWGGAQLNYDDKGTESFADDLVSLVGSVSACYGNSSCRGDDLFASYHKYKPKRYYFAGMSGDKGTYELDASFGVDANLTTGSDNFYAQMGNIGQATMVEQGTKNIGFRRNLKIGSSYTNLDLALKAHPDLGWAFRLYDDGELGDGVYRIETWLAMNGWLLNGAIRHETRPIEKVFNGNLIATRVGGPTPPTTEVPEPATSALLLAGLAGIAHKRRAAKKSA